MLTHTINDLVNNQFGHMSIMSFSARDPPFVGVGFVRLPLTPSVVAVVAAVFTEFSQECLEGLEGT